jgi:hypothetical protein
LRFGKSEFGSLRFSILAAPTQRAPAWWLLQHSLIRVVPKSGFRIAPGQE